MIRNKSIRHILFVSMLLTAVAGTVGQTVNPSISESVAFAGKRVELDRSDMYERYDRELTALVYTHGNVLLTLKRANRYFPLMAPILKKNGVPEDLLYLACVESYLNPRALSGAKAAGIWQFIPAAAREYGLEVNEYVDERYHPAKATAAACRYLKKLHSRFGTWESAAAAYNGGAARIKRELSSQGVSSAYNLYLTDETSRYIFRLLAMKEILENPRKYGFTLTADQLYYPIATRSVTVDGSVEDWAAWAKSHGTNYGILRELNPWIRAKKLPNKSGKSYEVLLPQKGAMNRSAQAKKVYNRRWIE